MHISVCLLQLSFKPPHFSGIDFQTWQYYLLFDDGSCGYGGPPTIVLTTLHAVNIKHLGLINAAKLWPI